MPAEPKAERTKVLSKLVAPWRVKAPVPLPMVVAAVPVELIKVVPMMVVAPLIALVPPETPIVLAADVPVPKVLVKEDPVAIVEAPVDDKEVKAPEAAVVAPIWVALIPVPVVLKVEVPVPEVMVKALVP